HRTTSVSTDWWFFCGHRPREFGSARHGTPATLDRVRKENHRCHALQEKLNGSITPRGTALSARTAGRTSSATIPGSKGMDIRRFTKETLWSSRSPRGKRGLKPKRS